MDWVDETIDAFGRASGIHGLRLDENSCLTFEIEGGRTLTLMDLKASGGDEVLVIMQAPLAHPHGAAARAALRLADFRRSLGAAPQLAVRGEDLVGTLRIPRQSFLLSTLEEAVAALFAFHDRSAAMEASP
jgi:hypothetical protein